MSGDQRNQDPTADRRFFFLHVMRTGGGTLHQYMLKNFEPDQIYPAKGIDVHPSQDLHWLLPYFAIKALTSTSRTRRAQIRVFTGHFPFMAVELLGENLTTITILRDPVERTLSYLRLMRSFGRDKGLPLEEIYEGPLLFPSLIRDHQAKLFA